MKAVVVQEPNRASYTTVPDPVPAPDEVIIKVAAAGLCGTDLHILRGEYEAEYPIVPGHEFAGTVAELGSAVDDLFVGDRVTVDPNIFCHRCAFCRSGKHNQCANLQAVGVNRDGAFAEYVAAPRETVYRIGDLPFVTAAFAEPLGCVVLAMQRTALSPGSNVLLQGAGPMGCLLTQALARQGAAKLVVSDLSADRLELVAQMGASDVVVAGPEADAAIRALSPGGYDLVVDATGIPAVAEAGFAYLAARGTYLFFGVCPRGERIEIEPYEVFRNDWRIVGSFALSYTIQEALRWLQEGRVDVSKLISHEIPLSQFERGLKVVLESPTRLKIMFLPEQ